MKTACINLLIGFVIALLGVACTSHENNRETIKNQKTQAYAKGMFNVHVKCQQSAFNVEKMLNEQEGVEKATCDLNTMVASVTFDSTKTNLDQLMKVIAEGGYDAGKFVANPKAKHLTPFCCQSRKK